MTKVTLRHLFLQGRMLMSRFGLVIASPTAQMVVERFSLLRQHLPVGYRHKAIVGL